MALYADTLPQPTTDYKTYLTIQWTVSNLHGCYRSYGLGLGMSFKNQWVMESWPPEFLVTNPSIALLELYPIVASLLIWGEELHDQCICLFSDNQSAVAMLAKGTSKCQYCQSLLRIFTVLSMSFNVDMQVKYIPGQFNEIAETLSRKQVNHFRRLVPDVDPFPRQLPVTIWPISKTKLLNLNFEEFLNVTEKP